MKICLSCDGVAAVETDRCVHCDVRLVPVSAVHYPVRRGEGDATNPLVGTVIDGKFLIQGVLGRGGMGTVYRACHQVSLLPLALKLLHPRLSARPEYRRGLLAEARKAGRVVHEHCARVIDVGETEAGTVYLAMELAEGEPLDAWVHGRGLPPAVAVTVLLQVCAALVAIHAAGLVHRDLSSRNVMVAVRDGLPVVKVLDFGIAQSLRLWPTSADDAGERAFANPVFSAPEHLAGQDVDARADLYSFGVLAYFVLSGRLPVDAADARAAARATMAGHLEPLPPLPGVPRRLVRLVQRCLRLDREQRPGTATMVLAELRSLLEPRPRWFPRASLIALALGSAGALVTFVRATPPFLRLVGSALPLSEGALVVDTPVRHLQRAALRTITAHFGGFGAGRLEVEVTQRGSLRLQQRLQPVVQRDGALVLSEAQESWQHALDGIARASVDGPVDVAFVVPGTAVLGSARVRIDDTAPQLHFDVQPENQSDRLSRDSVVRLRCSDDSGLQPLRLVLHMDGGAQHPFVLPPDTVEFALGAEMAKIYGATPALGPATIDLVGEDLAGNHAAVTPMEFTSCDFGAPVVLDVTGPQGQPFVPWRDGLAYARLRLDKPEPDLAIEVRDAGERVRSQGSPRAVGGACEIVLAAATDGEPFADGFYTFVVVDPAGNSTERSLPLKFKSQGADATFRAAGEAPVLIAGDEIVVGPTGASLDFSCSSTFTVAAVRLRATARGAEHSVELQPTAGGWHLHLPAMTPGRYDLEVDLEAEGGSFAPSTIVRPFVVLPERIEVRLPENSSRYLRDLLRSNLFAVEGGAVVAGAGVRIEAEWLRHLRGRVWSGPSFDSLSPQQLPEPGVAGRLLPPVRLLRGRNVLALELHDVLGRPVAVTSAERAVREVRRDDQSLQLIADFVDDPTPPELVGDELAGEFGQSMELRLRCNLQFADTDRDDIHLTVRSAELPCSSLRVVGTGCELAFSLQFPIWSAAADLGDLPRAEYARGRTAVIEATLHTPAGEYPKLNIPVRTVRTTLRPLAIGEFATAALPPPLATIDLVPVLSPENGVFDDPVPADVPGRELFRAQPAAAVRLNADYFVQDREFTLAAYAALMTAMPRLELGKAKPWHADDPLGADRLTEDGMLPLAWKHDRAAFLAAVREQPDAAVTGVDFYQAWCAVRLLGVLACGEPTLFRLPLGCELELAALGPQYKGDARNGPAAHGGKVRAAPWVSSTPPTPAGPSQRASLAIGDVVQAPNTQPGSSEGPPITGLDFGVREWVFDLPQGVDSGAEMLLREWLADRDAHVKRALEFATGRTPPAELQARLRMFGVVRGLPTGDRSGLVDDGGNALRLGDGDSLPPSVAGVVRTEQLRRDGRDLTPGKVDPRLLRTGFRVAGGDIFVQFVRRL